MGSAYIPGSPIVVPPQRPPRRKTPDYIVMLLVAGGVGVGLMIMAALVVLLIFGAIYGGGNVLPGVVVSGGGIEAVAVGSMSPEEATNRLQGITINRPLTLRDGSRTWSTTTADLGITVDAGATAAKAALVGRDDGGPVAGISTIISGTEITPVYTIDLAKAYDALSRFSDKVNLPPGQNDVREPGRSLNVTATLDKLPPDLSVLIESGTVDLVIDQVQGPRTKYTVQRGEELALIAKKFNVAMGDIVALNDIKNPDLLYPGQELLIPATGIWVPTDKDAPTPPTSTGKAIVVSLKNQRIYAYENGKLVHSALTSTGKLGTETIPGDYKVYVKYASTRMRGPDYDIPNVPWTMYFYQGYGIHGAFWHNNFGRVMSHGCVNLETQEAKWFFDFAPVGTPVRVLA
jgi:lipoprotein-anchoring transpeptidase ErfK/SrfK